MRIYPPRKWHSKSKIFWQTVTGIAFLIIGGTGFLYGFTGDKNNVAVLSLGISFIGLLFLSPLYSEL